nr:hypothetical protein B0A51_17972 [Rachicladosporium sp. CCFEE 5018]
MDNRRSEESATERNDTAFTTTAMNVVPPPQPPSPTLSNPWTATQTPRYADYIASKTAPNPLPTKPLVSPTTTPVPDLHDTPLEDGPSTTATWTPSRQVKTVLAGQTFCVFIVSLDMTILVATLPTVAKALDANATQAFWIAASYLLASAVVQPLVPGLADIFGRRSVVFGAVLAFTVGSIVCATAKSVGAMLGGRVIQGIGGGGILSANLVVLSDLIPLRQRSRFLGLIQLVFACGTNLAPIIGGALVKSSGGWRWLFWINLPFCAIGLAIIPFLLRYERPPSTVYEKLSTIDWVGAGLLIVSATSFLVGISWGGNQFAWRSAAVLVPLLVGAAGIFGTVLYERKYAKIPFLRWSLFQERSAVAACVCTVLQGFLLFALSYYLVLYMLACKLYTPIVSGAVLLPFAMTVIPVSGITGIVITRLGHYRRLIWLGWGLSVAGIALMIVLDVGTSAAAWVFIFMLAGAGQGLLLIAHSIAIQASCRPSDAAHASSMYSFMRGFGLCLGVVIGGTIFQNFFRHRLADLGLPIIIAHNAEGFVPALQRMSGVLPVKEQLQGAYAFGLRRLWEVLTGVAVCGLAISMAIEEKTLDTDHESEHVLKGSKRSSTMTQLDREK